MKFAFKLIVSLLLGAGAMSVILAIGVSRRSIIPLDACLVVLIDAGIILGLWHLL